MTTAQYRLAYAEARKWEPQAMPSRLLVLIEIIMKGGER